MALVLAKYRYRWVPETAVAADPPVPFRWLMQQDPSGDTQASSQVSIGSINGDDQIAVSCDCSGVAQMCGGVALATHAAEAMLKGVRLSCSVPWPVCSEIDEPEQSAAMTASSAIRPIRALMTS